MSVRVGVGVGYGYGLERMVGCCELVGVVEGEEGG